MKTKHLKMSVLSMALGFAAASCDTGADRGALSSSNTVTGAGSDPASANPAAAAVASASAAAPAASAKPAPVSSAPSTFASLRSPAGDALSARNVIIDGYNAAVLPNGRVLTPVGLELNVDAPKPFGLAVTLDGKTAATINSGASRFSVTMINNITATTATAKRIPINATFMGLVFSPDGLRYYASGGENGNIWIGNAATGQVIGSVNLNGTTHPLPSPSLAEPNTGTASGIISSFRGSFPGNMVVSGTGKHLYVVDQGNFSVHVIDTSKIAVGVDSANKILDMNNFGAVVGNVRVGRYPFGIALSPDEQRLYVANVGVFQYSHLIPRGPDRQPGGTLPPNLLGNSNDDYPLCFPALAYPDDSANDKTIKIKKIDATTISGLPLTLRDPEGIRCGYVSGDRDFTVPGLGSPNVDESSSVYVLDLTTPAAPVVTNKVKTGLKVGDVEHGIATYGASHPNAVAIGNKAVYVSNGNNDSVSILKAGTLELANTISLSPFASGQSDGKLKGVQPVALALSPDEKWLYVAEAGINAVAVLKLSGLNATVEGHIPTGWWPSSVKLSGDGRRLFVANAKGRGAPPNLTSEDGHPKHSVYGTVQIIDVPQKRELLQRYTERVRKNNGLDPVTVAAPQARPGHPIPSQPNVASTRIKHVVFITKENLTHDLVLGDVLETRKGVMVNGDPRLALTADATPNHHELALQFAFSDNFYLDPTVSSDGHRWLVNNYTSEFEETHWPASYGGKRRDAGNNLEIIDNWFGRLGFTDADGSPEPHDYPQHGNLFMHLYRHGKSFINFGEGHEFAIVDEDKGTEPTGIRQHVNVPMEKVLRDRTDHLYPQYNTTIPDSPLPNDPDRFNRFGRFKQVFNNELAKDGVCNLPAFTYLFYPNDHGGGANDINGPAGPAWDFKRYVQDNDAALGLTVELISKSPCWRDTVIFVTEDDTQSGLDHVDGYRSVFLAISPWIKREHVSKTHTSLGSIFKTMDLIFGIPPLNLYDAVATDLRGMFTDVPNYTPYTYVPVKFAETANLAWSELTANVDFQEMDADEVSLREAIMKSEGLPRKRPTVFRPRRVTAIR